MNQRQDPMFEAMRRLSGGAPMPYQAPPQRQVQRPSASTGFQPRRQPIRPNVDPVMASLVARGYR